jgi:hypothetical protein
MPFTKWASRHLSPAASHRLANLKSLKLRVIQIQRLILPCPAVCCPKRLRLGPGLKHCTVFPHRVRSIESMILGFGALEKVKLYKARYFVEMRVKKCTDPTPSVGRIRQLSKPTSTGHR